MLTDADLLERIAAGQIDLAYLGPLPYVALKKRLPQAVPLVHFKEKNGEASYTCALFADAEAKLGLKSDHPLDRANRRRVFRLSEL